MVASPLFAARGYSGVGMRQVAADVGLSKSALFHHFATKLQLYGAVLEACISDIDITIRTALLPDADPLAQLEAYIEVYIDVMADNPDYSLLLLRSIVEPEVLDPADELTNSSITAGLVDLMSQLLRSGMQGKRLRRVQVEHTVQTLIGMVVYHFASGEFGDELLGESVFSPRQVQNRKDHVLHVFRQLLRVDA